MATDPVSPTLAELADECGVSTGYIDARGVHHEVSARTVRTVLAALGVLTLRHDPAPDHTGDDDDESGPSDSDESALALVRDSRWLRLLPPTVVVRQGEESSFPVHIPRGATVRVRIEFEDGAPSLHLTSHVPSLTETVTETAPEAASTDKSALSRVVNGEHMDRLYFEIPSAVPAGWHRLVATVGPVDPHAPTDLHSSSATLLVPPKAIPAPHSLGNRQATGLAAQLYQVRSAGSWGMGDLSDLRQLVDWAGHDLGADFVLVNPMHAGEPFPPVEPSPYLPTSRCFASPLYLRPENIPEFLDLSAAARDRVEALAAMASASNSVDTIDRDASWWTKLEALRLIFAGGLNTHRAEEFQSFTQLHGDGLRNFATWCALAEIHGPRWSEWPEELRDPESTKVRDFAHEHADDVRFHEWLQWVVATQRGHAQQAALAAGMRLGIIHDLAVGVHPDGADSWALHHALARGVTVGAPPDIYNQRGQDWSQPPLRPDALAEQGYRPLRDIVRAALSDAGGVRIDHILGMFRLWWIPAGHEPTDGTYVSYDHEAMLAVLVLEASRAGAVVIGEDLGTVAPGVRNALADGGILGTSVLWFEQDSDGTPQPPESYRVACMASVTTHDLPPTAGYIDLVHVDIRAKLGQLTGDTQAERHEAAADIDRFISVLGERQLLAGTSVEELSVGLHALLGAAPSRLLSVSVADLAGDRRPVNIPGTSDEYPNWRVPLSGPRGEIVSLEELKESSLARRLMSAVHAAPQ